MVLLDRYDTAQQAAIVKGMLAANGIDAFTLSDGVSNVFPAPDAGIGTIGLYVDDASYDKAVELIRKHGDL